MIEALPECEGEPPSGNDSIGGGTRRAVTRKLLP